MIKGILFDFDGTLSNRVESAYFMYRWMVHEMLPEMNVHDIAFERIVQRCMLWDEYGTINKTHVLEMLKKYYVSDLDVLAWKDKWYATFHMFQVEMPQMYEVLTELRKRYKLGIITNGDAHLQGAKIDFLDLRKFFDTVIISKAFGADKPDVSIYQQGAKDLGLPCNEIAFIGDTFATDIVGAVNAGMMPLWYCYEHRGISLYHVRQVKDYAEIRDMFLVNTDWNQ